LGRLSIEGLVASIHGFDGLPLWINCLRSLLNPANGILVSNRIE
jgi:hypothetical protein